VLFRLHGSAIVALVESRQIEFLRRAPGPEPQRIRRARAEAGNHRIERHRIDVLCVDPFGVPIPPDRPSAEVNDVLDLGARKLPRVAGSQPIIGRFDLLALNDLLTEHAVVVPNAVAEPGNGKRCHRIEKASRQPPEAAVAERGVGLEIGDGFHVDTEARQRFFHFVVNAEREQRIRERAADEEFHRQVVDALDVLLVLLAGGFHPAGDEPVAHGKRRGVEPVLRPGRDGVFADAVHQPVGDGALERIDGTVELVEFQIDGCHRVPPQAKSGMRLADARAPRHLPREWSGYAISGGREPSVCKETLGALAPFKRPTLARRWAPPTMER
jgi:hypothetical protein